MDFAVMRLGSCPRSGKTINNGSKKPSSVFPAAADVDHRWRMNTPLLVLYDPRGEITETGERGPCGLPTADLRPP
jgi:hypothetical protein